MKRTGQTSSDRPASPASPRTIDAVAAQWVERRRARLDEAGERDLAAWLAASPAHDEAFSRMLAMSAVFQRARSQGAGATIRTQLEIRHRRQRARRKITATVACALLLALSVGSWIRYRAESAGTSSPAVAQAAQSIRRLSDGSIVELNRGAEIVVSYDAAFRRVQLVRGEALFRVEKDPSRPFLVRAAGVEVRAVGTAFNVRLGTAAVEVLVTEGKVGIDDTARGGSLLPKDPTGSAPLLVAGQRMVAEGVEAKNALPTVQVAQVAPEEIKTQLSWRIPRFEFEGVELAAAVAQMNRENRLQLVIPDEATRKLRISGTFLTDDPQTFARLAAASLGLEVERHGDTELVLRAK